MISGENFIRSCFPTSGLLPRRMRSARILALTQCSGGSVLDLCCGPGRHSVELARRGFQVTGVDRSPFLLAKAREQAAKSGASVEWVEQDMRNFVRPASFDLALSLFTSFGYFEDEQDDLRVLRNIHQSLKENGVLIIEVLGKERLARVWKDTMCNELADGSLIFQRPQIRDDWTRIHSEWTLVKDGTRGTLLLNTRFIPAVNSRNGYWLRVQAGAVVRRYTRLSLWSRRAAA